MRKRLKEALTDERGASLIEYAMIIAMASIAAIAALVNLGNKVNSTLLNNAASQLP